VTNEIVGIGALYHFEQELALQHSPPNVSHIQVLVILLLNPTTHPSKKFGLQIAGRVCTKPCMYIIANPPTWSNQSIKLSRG
jgi:hypothetical protein